eukprot:TRINITY_DN1716_c1_g1_i1.p1 TRINITY_DN1716_c1_g1~~TRINITY_DN1716_c1_g1_i1.p1  ORF type:complete len:2014 (+),score=692.67 TRINITY_DN1716_c1_g1_i1:1276-7317(+)
MSGNVNRVDKRRKETEKLVVVTDVAVYYFPPLEEFLSHYSGVRRIDFREIKGIQHNIDQRRSGKRYLLVQVDASTSYGDKAGDLLLSGSLEGFFTAFVSMVPPLVSKYRKLNRKPNAEVKSATFESMVLHAKLEKRDAVAKTFGEAKKMTNVLTRGGKKLGKGIKRLGGTLGDVKAVAKGVKHVAEGLGQIGVTGLNLMMDFDATTAGSGSGVHESLLKAAEEIHLHKDKLTSSRGNAVFVAVPEAKLNDIRTDPRAEHTDDSKVTTEVLKQKHADLPMEPVKYAAWCTQDDLSVLLVVSQSHISLFNVAQGGNESPKDILSHRNKMAQMGISDLRFLVTCPSQPDDALLMFQRTDYILTFQRKGGVSLLAAYLMRLCKKLHRKVRLRYIGNPAMFKILQRKHEGESMPQLCLVSNPRDDLHLASCENVIRLLEPYGEKDVFFSGLAITYTHGQEKLSNHFVAVTETAIYLLVSMKERVNELKIKRRLAMPQVCQLLVNKNDNNEVVTQSTRYELSLTYQSTVQKSGAFIKKCLEDAFRVKNVLRVTCCEPGHVVFEVFPATLSVINSIKKLRHRAVRDLEATIANGAHIKAEEVEMQDDMWLLFRKSAEDFVAQVCRVRGEWSAYGIDDALPVEYKSPEKNEKNALIRGLNHKKGPATKSDPLQIRKELRTWFETQLVYAMDDPATLQHELERGAKTGLSSESELRSCVAEAKAKVEEVRVRDTLLSKLRSYIERGKFGKFDDLVEKGDHIKLPPVIVSYQNKGFRCKMRWSRLAGCSIRTRYYDGYTYTIQMCTVQEAIELCKDTEEIVGFTYIGSEASKGEVEVEFKTSQFTGRRLDRMNEDKRELVALDIIPNPSALVDVLQSTTWLKKPDELKLLKKEKADALNRKMVLNDIKRTTAIIAEADWKSCGTDMGALKALVRSAHSFPEKDRHTLLEYQLRFSAAIQRRIIRSKVGSETAPLSQICYNSWLSLEQDKIDMMWDEVYRDPRIKKVARSMHNCLLEYHTTGVHGSAALEEQYWNYFRELDRLLSEFEDVPPDMESRLYKQRWRSRHYVHQAYEAETIKRVAEESMECLCVMKQIKSCITENDIDTLDALQKEYGEETELQEDFKKAYQELQNYKDRRTVLNKASNSLNTAGRLFKNLGQASEQEVNSAVQTLVELEPQLEKFPSLVNERVMTVFLKASLQSHLRAVASEVERQAAEKRFREAAEEANRQRFEVMQARLGRKEIEKQERDKLIAEKYYTKACGMKKEYDANVSQLGTLKGDIFTASRRRKDCSSELENARSQAKNNTHETLQKAIEMFEEILAKWDVVLGAKDELERKALAKEITRIIESEDASKYLDFVKPRVDDLPTEELKRLRLGLSALVSKKKEQTEAFEAVNEAMHYKAAKELEAALKTAEKKGVDMENEVIIKAKAMLADMRMDKSHKEMNETIKALNNTQEDVDVQLCASPDKEEDKESERSFIDSEDDAENAGSFLGANPFANGANGSAEDLHEVKEEQQEEPPLEEPEPPSEPTLLDELGPPRGRAHVQQLRDTIVHLLETSDVDPHGVVKCHLNNPHTRAYVTAWMDLLKYNLKPQGKMWKLGKKNRTEYDLMIALENDIYKVHEALEGFNTATRMNPHSDVNRFLMHYFMQSGRFYHIIVEMIDNRAALEKLYSVGAVLLFETDLHALFTLMKVIKRLRFDFGLEMSAVDIEYLKAIDAAFAPKQEVPKAAAVVEAPKTEVPNPQGTSEGEGEKEKVEEEEEDVKAKESQGDEENKVIENGTHSTKEEASSSSKEASPTKNAEADKQNIASLLSNTSAFNTAGARAKLKIAVTQLLQYTADVRARYNLKRGEKLKEAFTETKHHAVGVLMRERICPAILAIMTHGYKESVRFRKRHLWQFVEMVAAKKKTGKGWGAIKLPEGIDTVKNVIDMKLATLTAPTRSGHSVNDFKLRALIIHALNKQLLKIYLETLYDLSKESEQLNKEWFTHEAIMFDPSVRPELDSVFDLLDGLNFHIHLDADVW